MKILLIKLTSMGDLMLAFPALTDALKAIPDIRIDWVVDESFADVPQWHPAVNKVIKTAHRRWKKNLISCIKKGELRNFYRQLNQDNYDVIVDFQGNIKSAMVSWLRRGPVHGYDKASCREKPAHWAYTYRHGVSKQQHAVERQRQLLAKVLGYTKQDAVADYGVDFESLDFTTPTLPEKYVIFVHNASWPTKLWPVDHWQQLVQRVAQLGYSILLPCGNAEEYQRAQAIAATHVSAIALPKMDLNTMAGIMSKASAAVCSDTGLAHLAAVAAIPAITLYAVTDTQLIGTDGKNQQHIIAEGEFEKRTMNSIDVDTVWSQLQPLLQEKSVRET